jgi:hypothetical protein
MKTKLRRFLAAGLYTLAAHVLLAQQSMVPEAMNYQGVLTDALGNPVAPTAPENRNVEFRIYAAAAGGQALWGETQTVTIFKGNFSVILGNGTALGGDTPSQASGLAAVFANTTSPDLFFGITPQGGAEFAPRQKLVSSAFALRARVAENVVSTTGDNSLRNLTVSGDLRLSSGVFHVNAASQIRFGDGIPGRSPDSGLFQATPTSMNISGMSNTGSDANRRITMWAEGGTDFTGPISFGSRTAQHIHLFGTSYGIGIQSDNLYQRSATNFAWYRGGVHSASGAGTGGTVLANLTPTGFDLKVGRFSGDGSGLTNISATALPNNYNYLGINGTNFLEFGRGLTKEAAAGRIGYQTFSPDALDIVGAGTLSTSRKVKLWAEGGTEMTGGVLVNGQLTSSGALNAKSDVLIEGTGKLRFSSPFRLGQHIDLWDTGYGIGVGTGTLYQRTGTRFKWYVGGTHNADNAGTGGVTIADWDNTRIDFTRRVQIVASTSSTTLYPLDIVGASNLRSFSSVSHFYRVSAADTGFDNKAFSASVSIRASAAVQASEFIAMSDLRLKLSEGRSDAAKDLETLGALEITDYKMKDKSVAGERPIKKLIAQQVEEVYPQAVSRSTGTVPDIFRLATAKDGFIKFNEREKVDLKVGETVRIVGDDSELMAEVTGVTGQGFTVKDTVKDGELFVYGRQVDDLLALDYEAIAMLNVSATQELARQLKAQTEKLAAVKSERDALALEVNELRATTSRQDSRLSAIEAQIEALARPVAALVSLPANEGGN